MKKHPFIIKSVLLTLGLFTILWVNSCSKDSDDPGSGNIRKLPDLLTTQIADVTRYSVKASGEITDEGDSKVIEYGFCWSIEPNPTIDNASKALSVGEDFSHTITGLLSNTIHHVRAYATNSSGTAYGQSITFSTWHHSSQPFTDARDGNVYNTVRVGEQIWMAENLRYLPEVHPPDDISSDNPRYYVYNYSGADVEKAKEIDTYNSYGVLYNWTAAVMVEEDSLGVLQGVCPTGWQLPTLWDFILLNGHFGGSSVSGGKLKSELGWLPPNVGATNESGFNGTPGGFLTNSGSFVDNRRSGLHWFTGSNEFNCHALQNSNIISWVSFCFSSTGRSIRCVKK